MVNRASGHGGRPGGPPAETAGEAYGPRQVTLAGNLASKRLEGLAGVDCVEVVGVGDPEGSRAEQAAAAFGAEAFTDHRQRLQQSKPDILVATGALEHANGFVLPHERMKQRSQRTQVLVDAF